MTSTHIPLQKKDFSGTTLLRFCGVPVVVRADFWPIPIGVTGLLAWAAGRRKPQRSFLQRLGIGLLAMPVAVFADVGHALAHTVSARLAGAPMDMVFLSSGMPRTLYWNNAVAPKTHIQRSLGGLIFSGVMSILSRIGWQLAPHGSLRRDLAALSTAAHSFILLGSLTPLPIVDGGTILKWKLVEAGQEPAQADRTVRTAAIGLSACLLAVGALLGLVQKRRVVGGLLAVGSAASAAAAVGWLK